MSPEPLRSIPTVASPPPVAQEQEKEPDIRKYAVRFQITPGATQTHGDGPHDDLNAAVFERNTLFRTNERVGRTWIDVVSGGQILRRWGHVMKREWSNSQPAVCQHGTPLHDDCFKCNEGEILVQS